MPQLKLEHRMPVVLALDSFKSGRGDFSDYLIAQIGRQSGCDTTLTFDKRLTEQDLFAVQQIPAPDA